MPRPRPSLLQRLNWASHPNAVPSELTRLARDRSQQVRMVVAYHPKTPTTVLRWMATHDVNAVQQVASQKLRRR